MLLFRYSTVVCFCVLSLLSGCSSAGRKAVDIDALPARFEFMQLGFHRVDSNPLCPVYISDELVPLDAYNEFCRRTRRSLPRPDIAFVTSQEDADNYWKKVDAVSPMHFVNYFDASAFCAYLNEYLGPPVLGTPAENRPPLGYFRLPTVHELKAFWDNTPHDRVSTATNNSLFSWTCTSPYQDTAPHLQSQIVIVEDKIRFSKSEPRDDVWPVFKTLSTLSFRVAYVPTGDEKIRDGVWKWKPFKSGKAFQEAMIDNRSTLHSPPGNENP